MNYTTSNHELSTPLLGNLLPHESDTDAYDEECCISCSLKINVGDDEEEKSDDDSSQCRWWFDSFLGLVVPPALLFYQFGMAFSASPVEATTGMQLSVVNFSIVMFVVTAGLYRQTVHDFQITFWVARLLPEIIIGAVLGLVFCGQVAPAFLLLLISMLCMTVLGLALDIFVAEGFGWTSHDVVSERKRAAES
jgi:hypothetical protein